MRRQVLQLAARAVEAHLNTDCSDTDPVRSCECGEWARYVGRRRKRFQTALGEMQLERAYYHCSPCRRGFCPRDRELGLEGSSLSPAVARMVAVAASSVSFQESSQLLSELAAVRVEAKQVERCAESMGEEIAAYERQVVGPDS